MGIPNWVFTVITIIFMGASPFLAWWGATRFFAGQFIEWRKSSEEWRLLVDRRLEKIDTVLASTTYAVVIERLNNLEKSVNNLREWKHVRVDPYIPGAVDALKSRVDSFEKRGIRERRG